MFYIVDRYERRMTRGVNGSTIAEEYYTCESVDECYSVISYYFDMEYGDKFGIVDRITGNLVEWVENDEQ